MRKKTPEDMAAIELLRDRMLLIISFLENAQDFPSAGELRDIVQLEASKGNLRGLRLMSRDIEAMTNTLEPHEREGLEALLQSRLGVDKDSERSELQKWAASVLERGTIRSEKERRRLEDYLEMLTATGGNPAEISSVQALLRSA